MLSAEFDVLAIMAIVADVVASEVIVAAAADTKV